MMTNVVRRENGIGLQPIPLIAVFALVKGIIRIQINGVLIRYMFPHLGKLAFTVMD